MRDNDIALIGLAVMGQNLALNMARNGLAVTVFNRTWDKTEAFMAGPARESGIIAARDLKVCMASLRKPRTVFLMVKAGPPVDALLDELLPFLEPGDVVMDGGNSLFSDTQARIRRLEPFRVSFLGVGVSGGERGALLGPSIMSGGSRDAWARVAPLLESIAARAADGSPCTGWMGRDGAGHFVKMVHNGIEYGVMQLLAEMHDLLSRALGLGPDEEAAVFAGWNGGQAASYLLEITADILRSRDPLTGAPMVDVIRDSAGSKGTGLWTTQSALQLGVPAPTITAAVEARMLSALQSERRTAAAILPGPHPSPQRADQVALGDALYMATLAAYAQGFALLRAAEKAWGWGMEPAAVARVWRAGCIIRAAFLDDLARAFESHEDLPNLLLAPSLSASVARCHPALRGAVRLAADLGVPAPALSASLSWYDAWRSPRLPASLLQAQRDFFGAHGFERTDREGTFHGPWK